MSLTLWRGDHLLGELRTRAPSLYKQPSAEKGPSLAAFLIPAAGVTDLAGLWQVHSPIGPYPSVRQFPNEADIVAERAQRAAARKPNPGPVALEPMSPEEAAGVPPELQLTVHDTAGRSFLPRMIDLMEVRYEPAMYEYVLREAPSEALVNGSVWCVFVSFASELQTLPI